MGVIRSRSATMSTLVRSVPKADSSSVTCSASDGDLGQRVDPAGGVVFQHECPELGELHLDNDPLEGSQHDRPDELSCS